MNCENCKTQHNGLYASGRFCSKKCAKGFSTKKNRAEINKKVSNALKGRKPKYPHKFSVEENRKGGRRGARTRWGQRNTDFKRLTYEELVTKYNYKRLGGRVRGKYLSERIRFCDRCKNKKWLGKDIPLEIHHKDGNKSNIKKDNIELICPNCHVFTNNYKFRGRNHINYPNKKQGK